MWTYHKAEMFYSRKKKCNPYKTIDHSGRLFYDKENDEYEFQLHRTIIAKVNRNNEFTLAANGWTTPLTAGRIREYTSFACHKHRLRSVQNDWVVGRGWSDDGQVVFYDGIKLDQSGRLLSKPKKFKVSRVDREVSQRFSVLNRAIWKKLATRIIIGEFDDEEGPTPHAWDILPIVDRVAAYDGEFVPHEMAAPLFCCGERLGPFGRRRYGANNLPRFGEDAFRIMMGRARKAYYEQYHGYITVEVDHVGRT
jgi:hypothetical protein